MYPDPDHSRREAHTPYFTPVRGGIAVGDLLNPPDSFPQRRQSSNFNEFVSAHGAHWAYTERPFDYRWQDAEPLRARLSSISSSTGIPALALERNPSTSSSDISSPHTPMNGTYPSPHTSQDIEAAKVLSGFPLSSQHDVVLMGGPTKKTAEAVHVVKPTDRKRSFSDLSSTGNPEKRTYPCPLSESAQCFKRFSTSGHAKRHSRVHTHEKNSKCPECGGSFSRKDNMEQHRRTHRNSAKRRQSVASAIQENQMTGAASSSAS
jgi:uncharacterized Zn-finger protein